MGVPTVGVVGCIAIHLSIIKRVRNIYEKWIAAVIILLHIGSIIMIVMRRNV